MTEPPLTPVQSAALFDILTHYETYAEIREFRHPGSLAHYGPPFAAEANKPSTSPALQILVSKFLLTLPGLKNLPPHFWKVQCKDIIDHLEKANLSESYDKGVIGIRKTLATAVSALIEYPVRGTYGGFPQSKSQNPKYDVTNAQDLSRSFRDFMNQTIYGNVLDDLIAKTAETDNLDDHEPLTKALHEYVLVNLASFMHYTLILSPKGQYLLKLVDNANKLVPYMVLKQTLRIGNVASMIQAMVKVGLAKVSVASVTNWMGLTQHQDEGMNLMQTIISTVLHWDIKDLHSRASKIEGELSKTAKHQLSILKEYLHKSQHEQDQIRKDSQTHSSSIVMTILKHHNSTTEFSEAQHKQLLDYLSARLSIRDRKELIKVLCRGTPDHLTQSVRQLVDAYEPVIRRAHKAIDLSATLGDFEYFLKDLIKLGRIPSDKGTGWGATAGQPAAVPTVGDFVQLLRKHQRSCHVFLHQCCKNDKELTGWYLEWAKYAAMQFKRDVDGDGTTKPDDPSITEKGAGSLTPSLHRMFEALTEDKRRQIIPVLDTHSEFLQKMHEQSAARLARVLKSPPSKSPAIAKIFSSASSRPVSRSSSPGPMAHNHHHAINLITSSSETTNGKEGHESGSPALVESTSPGPGAYLARWQALLDATAITPLTPSGPPKRAASPEVVQNSATDVDGTKMVQFGGKEARGDHIRVMPEGTGVGSGVKGNHNDSDNDKDKDKTNAGGIGGNTRERQKGLRIVVEAMGDDFRKLLAVKGCNW